MVLSRGRGWRERDWKCREGRSETKSGMNFKKTKGKFAGLTLVELLVVIAVIVILAAILLPAHVGSRRANVPVCMSNQKQIAIDLIIFEDDHAGKFPSQVSMTNGGSFEIVSNRSAASQFKTLLSYFGGRPNLLICPVDKTRHAATNVTNLKNENISYFLNLDAITNMNSVLTGDRHLELNHRAVSSGVFLQTTNMGLNWSSGFHGSASMPGGVLSFSDGHAQFAREEQLNLLLQAQPLETNRFCFP